jgi:adenosylcobinamide-phosphate synthase
VQAWIASLPLPLQALLLGLLLKPTLAWRMLRDEVWAVEAAQAQSLVAARRRVARLVSRDVRHATGPQVRQAALSTLAENLNDSVLSPLLWWAIAGLPGAALYRYANTADAMWGYRGVRNGRDWTWAGRWAARADDVLSWPGARLSAALLLAAAPAWRAVRLLPAEVRRTPSPNSGWPMAALALALDLVLAKPGVYVIHARGRLPAPQDTARALSLCARVVALCALACAGLLLAAWGRGLG